MTELMVHDVTNPPLAMRFFSYTCLAGYQVISAHDSTLPRISEHLNGYPTFEKIDFTNSDPNLAAIIAMMEVSKKSSPQASGWNFGKIITWTHVNRLAYLQRL